MTLQQFIDKYLGKTVGYPAGSYVGECLSLVKQYMKEVYGFNPPASGCNAARCYWSMFPSPLPQYFKKVVNTLEAIPNPGDIVVWNEKAGGGYGHIAIVTKAEQSWFQSFDQNWQGRHAHSVAHNYDNVYGWLTPIKPENEPIEGQQDMSKALKHFSVKDEDELIQMVEKELKFLADARKDNQRLKNELNDQALYAGNLEDQVEKLQKEKKSAEGQLQVAQANLADTAEQILLLKARINALQDRLDAQISTHDQTEPTQNSDEEQISNLIMRLLKKIQERLGI